MQLDKHVFACGSASHAGTFYVPADTTKAMGEHLKGWPAQVRGAVKRMGANL